MNNSVIDTKSPQDTDEQVSYNDATSSQDTDEQSSYYDAQSSQDTVGKQMFLFFDKESIPSKCNCSQLLDQC